VSGVLLDTNIVSLLMRNEGGVSSRARAARSGGADLLLCPVVDYEIRRGLLKRGAQGALRSFEAIRSGLVYEPFDEATWRQAAELWAASRRLGQPIPDADLLIAAQALQLEATLATDNQKRFEVFKPLGLTVENWKQDVLNG
jgi:predicted nucleic acid-binding protein